MTSPEFWSGESFGWRYMAQRVDGSGTPGEWLDNELPLRDVSITDVISGPTLLQATISPVYRRLLGPDGFPLLDENGTAIYAEQDGLIRAGTLMADSVFGDPEWGIEASGFTGYAKGMGYEGDKTFPGYDPLDVIRHAWDHIQDGQNSNIGLQLDRTTKTGRMLPPPMVQAEDGTWVPASYYGGMVQAEDGSWVPVSYYGEDEPQPVEPLRFASWLTDDLGDEIDTLAKDHSIEYHERHQWNADKTQVEHFLDFAHPRMGERRDLRFVLGENVQTKPQATRSGSAYANHVRFIGAGEGSATIRAEARISDGRLRRMVTLDDKDVRSQQEAEIRARDELARRMALTQVASVMVRNTEETPLGSWTVGDEIRLQADLDWISFDYWFRVLSITIAPENPEIIAMSIRRTDA